MKKFASILVFILILPFVLVGCGQKEAKFTSYAMKLEYQHENKTLTGSMVVDYVNNSDNAFNELYFHLYPNAFREDAKYKPVSATAEERAYPHGKSYGDIAVNGVLSGGKDVKYEVCGQDQNLLKVELPSTLYPDERIKINIVFKVKLANINHRLGYGDNAVNFGNFYPIACVYDEGQGFMTSPYSSNGDPFYSDVANYEVEISYPENFVLATSGVKLSESVKEGKKVSLIEGEKIRDFCFVLSTQFKEESKKVGDVTVKYFYYNDDNSSHSLEVSCKAIETYSTMFGHYPYESLSVVQTNFVHGGMEYPNLVMISDAVTGADYDYVIAHEIAHQWWYGVVGNNQYSHAWMDEGLTDYSTFLFFRENPEFKQNFDTLVDGATASYKLFVELYTRLNGKADTSMERSLDEFATEPEYVACTYTKGALLFDTLRETVGERKFFKALKDYFKYFGYENASPADMISCFENSTGYKLEGFFETWLNGQVVVI